MARDIAGLLTGISSRQQPVQQAVPGSPDFYGKFMAARGQGLQQGLGRLARGGAPSRQEQIEGSMFQLSNPTTAAGEAKDTATRIADLTKLAQVQQMRGNPTGAMQSLAQVQQLQQKEQKRTAKTGLIAATKTAITEKYGEKRKDLLALADQGMSLQEVDSFAKINANDRYKVVGNNVLDVTTGEYLSPPKGAGKEGYTVQKFYDPEKGANVVQFLDKADPSIVLREEIDTKDMGRQSATLLNLQSENLEMANEAGKQAREANAVANRLEKAAAEGMTGGVLAQGEEFIKSILGSEDETTLLRKSADRLRVSRAVANLPVGPASDKDVALVLGGELSSTADPKTVADYVRGIAKLAKAERDFYSTQNAWLDTYKGDIGGFSSYVQKEQLEKQLGHSSIVAAEKRLAEVNYDPAALAIFEQKFGFDYMDAKQKLDRANKTLATLKREDF